MQAIHAQNEQTDKNAVAKLIANKMLNYALGFELSTTDIVRNQEAFEMLNKQPELNVHTAQAAAYMNNYEKTDEDTKLEKITTGFAGSDAANVKDLDLESRGKIKKIIKCLKCFLLKCKLIC
jgi:prolyl oligopeptidase PreP (S9A serine peptidase family)